MLDSGCWILDSGCWILDSGCWILDTGCSILYTENRHFNIFYLLSSYLLSNICYLISVICICFPVSAILDLLSSICYQVSAIQYLLSSIRYPVSSFDRLTASTSSIVKIIHSKIIHTKFFNLATTICIYELYPTGSLSFTGSFCYLVVCKKHEPN